jgi:hypothetical protein
MTNEVDFLFEEKKLFSFIKNLPTGRFNFKGISQNLDNKVFHIMQMSLYLTMIKKSWIKARS